MRYCCIINYLKKTTNYNFDICLLTKIIKNKGKPISVDIYKKNHAG